VKNAANSSLHQSAINRHVDLTTEQDSQSNWVGGTLPMHPVLYLFILLPCCSTKVQADLMCWVLHAT
jgi:hypothetical protein